MKYYVSFDCGTQSVKTALYDESFSCVAEHSIPTEIEYPMPGWAQMDAEGYVNRVISGIKVCMECSGVDPGDVVAICGDGIIMGVVGVNTEGKAITPYVFYLDSRASEEEAYAKSLDPIWIEESGNCRIESLMPPLIAMWLNKHDENFKKDGVAFVNNGPYTLSRLAGLPGDKVYIDEATLGGWILGYDAEAKTWSSRQLEALGLPREVLPHIVPSASIVGELTQEMADATGLNAGTPIVAGAGDTMQSLIGCGVCDFGCASDIAGTAAMFGVVVDGIYPKLSRNPGLYFSCATIPGTYFYWGYIRAGGLSLQWFRDSVQNRPGDSSFYDEANELAAKIPAGANGTIFFPYLQGGHDELRNASACFLNMTSNTGLGEMWRAILESIGYEYMTLINTMRESGVDINEVVVTEGGSNSDVWNQIKADMLDVTVHTKKNKQGAIMSNAVLAAYALGHIDDISATIADLLEEDKTFTPIPENREYYRKSYKQYMNILKVGMQDVFAACQDLRKL